MAWWKRKRSRHPAFSQPLVTDVLDLSPALSTWFGAVMGGADDSVALEHVRQEQAEGRDVLVDAYRRAPESELYVRWALVYCSSRFADPNTLPFCAFVLDSLVPPERSNGDEHGSTLVREIMIRLQAVDGVAAVARTDEAAVQVLLKHLTHPLYAVRVAASQALRELPGRPIPDEAIHERLPADEADQVMAIRRVDVTELRARPEGRSRRKRRSLPPPTPPPLEAAARNIPRSVGVREDWKPGPHWISVDGCLIDPPVLTSTGDTQYGALLYADFLGWAWKAFKFDYDHWNAWGVAHPYNIDEALARTFNAIYALMYSTDKPWTAEHGPNMLEWVARWMVDVKGDYPLWAGCKDGAALATTYGAGCTQYRKDVHWDCKRYEDHGYESCDDWGYFSWICMSWFWVSSLFCVLWGWVTTFFCAPIVFILGLKRITLWRGCTYYLSVPERAAVLVHEARHVSGKSHRGTFPYVKDSGYEWGADGADESFRYDGAFCWEVTWLAWYWYAATNSNDGLRGLARHKANTILAGAFEEPPGIVI